MYAVLLLIVIRHNSPRPGGLTGSMGSKAGTSATGAGSASIINGIVSATGQGIIQPGPCGFSIVLGIGIGVETTLGNLPYITVNDKINIFQ